MSDESAPGVVHFAQFTRSSAGATIPERGCVAFGCGLFQTGPARGARGFEMTNVNVALRASAGLCVLLALSCTRARTGSEQDQGTSGSGRALAATSGAGAGSSGGAAGISATPPNRVIVDAGPPTLDAGAEPGEPPAADAAEPAQAVPCSDEQPPHRGPCGDEGEVCARWRTDETTGDDVYFACHCRAESSTSLVWSCYEGGQTRCPHETQNHGDSCFGYRDRTCPYPPQRTCSCPIVGEALWHCVDPSAPPPPLSTIDPEKLVRDLTGAERQAWCAWLLDASVEPGFPLPRDLSAEEGGFYPQTGCQGCAGGIGIDGMIPIALPVSACVDNLAISTCEATMADFDDCIRSMLSECWPQPRGCDGTIASRGPSCRVRVESP
jgi:hypothetical protein